MDAHTMRHRRREPVDLGPLFAVTSEPEASQAAATETAEGIAAGEAQAATRDPVLVDQLCTLMRGLAKLAGDYGTTVADLRIAAVGEKILPAESEGRELSWLSTIPRRAGLVATDRVRRSHVDGSHGNRHTVWVLPAAQESAA